MVQIRPKRATSIGVTRQYWLHLEGALDGPAVLAALSDLRQSKIRQDRFDVAQSDSFTRISVLLRDIDLGAIEPLRVALFAREGVDRVYVVRALTWHDVARVPPTATAIAVGDRRIARG